MRAKVTLCQVQSNSMSPTLYKGDWLELASPSLQSGAILVLQTPEDRLVVHRLIRTITNGDEILLITRGDNTHHSDPPWQLQQAIGQAARVIRSNRTFEPGHRISHGVRLTWARAWSRHQLLNLLRGCARRLPKEVTDPWTASAATCSTPPAARPSRRPKP